AAGTDMIVAIAGTVAKKSIDKGATWTQIATGLRQDYYSMVTMRIGATNYLYMANGDTTIKKYDGTTWSTVANAPSGVKYLAPFNGRLYAAGHSGVIVQGSKINNPEVWASPDGLTVQILTHDGDPPTGLYQIGPHLLVFDRDATSYIDGFGQQTLIIAAGATGYSRSVGCVAFRSIVGVGDNAICWLSLRGIEYYSPGVGIVLVSKGIQTFLASIDWEQLQNNPGRPSATYDQLEQNYHLALPTSGTHNNRMAVINLRQNVQWQRPGPKAAASIDRTQSTSGGDLLFGGDSDGYLTAVPGGFDAKSDANGYMTLVTGGEGGDLVSEDANGYIEVVTDDTLPATLFLAPITERSGALHSVGYDGFVRKHYGVNSDDMISAGTGGVAVAMTIVSAPFLFKRPRQRKKTRAAHVTAIADASATLTLVVRSGGKTTGEKTMTIPATAFNQGKRRRILTSIVGDAPQLEVRTTDDVRISLLGLSSQLLREVV
ncbi:hypothetical protein LCGC14_2531090, partial [marine sediment metagenome]